MISIIIPTLNEESVLEKTLKNLREITKFPIEIIVSDGGSIDKTIEIAKGYADKIVVHEGKERQTIGGGRNMGAKEASGEDLLFIDADVTIPDPNIFIEKIIERFKIDEELIAATVRIKVLKENETLADKIFSTIAMDWVSYLSNNIFKTGGASGEFQFIKKSFFDKVGGFNEKLAASEDYDLFIRLAKEGKTKMFYDMAIYHTGRRFHKVGWFRVLSIWTANFVLSRICKKTISKVWIPIR